MIYAGENRYKEKVYIDLFSTNTAISGMTRSGKSASTYGLLAQVQSLSVVICGADPTGIMLNPLKGKRGEEFRAICASPKETAETLSRIVQELDNRIAYLRIVGLDQIKEFTEKRPRLLVILEEYAGILGRADLEDKNAAKSIRISVQRLVMEGLKVGISTLIICQRFTAQTVGGEVRANLGNRISFLADNVDSIKMLHPSFPNPETLLNEMRTWEQGKALVEIPRSEAVATQFDYLPYELYRQKMASR